MVRCGLLLCILVLAGCARSDPETALRETIAEVQATVERRDAAAMQQFLAEDFIGNDGLDRDSARRLAAALMLRYRSVGATFGPLEVRMMDAHATVRFTAMLAAGSGMPLPETAQVYDVETGWRLQDGDWKLASARWTPQL